MTTTNQLPCSQENQQMVIVSFVTDDEEVLPVSHLHKTLEEVLPVSSLHKTLEGARNHVKEWTGFENPKPIEVQISPNYRHYVYSHSRPSCAGLRLHVILFGEPQPSAVKSQVEEQVPPVQNLGWLVDFPADAPSLQISVQDASVRVFRQYRPDISITCTRPEEWIVDGNGGRIAQVRSSGSSAQSLVVMSNVVCAGRFVEGDLVFGDKVKGDKICRASEGRKAGTLGTTDASRLVIMVPMSYSGSLVVSGSDGGVITLDV
jgi:hypothetical protein